MTLQLVLRLTHLVERRVDYLNFNSKGWDNVGVEEKILGECRVFTLDVGKV